VPEASAAFIQITGKADLQVEWEGETGRLYGNYTLTNQGDDVASYVYPSFAFGHSVWVGDKKVIQPKSSERWSVELNISSADIRFVGEESSTLSMDGRYPLFVTYRYEDRNGRKFSAVEIVTLSIGSD